MAFAVLKWTPETFWAAVPSEFWMAFKGHRKANGLDRSSHGLTDEDKRELLDMMNNPSPQALKSMGKTAHDNG